MSEIKTAQIIVEQLDACSDKVSDFLATYRIERHLMFAICVSVFFLGACGASLLMGISGIWVGALASLTCFFTGMHWLRVVALKNNRELIVSFVNHIGDGSIMLEQCRNMIQDESAFTHSQRKAEDVYALLCIRLSINQTYIRDNLG
jgi:hypothetical protein